MGGGIVSREDLFRIGEEMVICSRACEGVEPPGGGVVPRCLFLEEGPAERGAIVIGMNPGRTSQIERKYYDKQTATYDSTIRFWEAGIKDTHRYYVATRGVIRDVGLTGPILWTELAKCENAAGRKEALPLQTFRTCARHFLMRELQQVPADWIVFAIGREAFKASAYMLADRTVIGIPHPTGSRGHFAALLEAYDGPLRPAVRESLSDILSLRVPVAQWLSTR